MDRSRITHPTFSSEETLLFGQKLGKFLSQARSSVVCFFGGLGAGKTTLIKGLVAGATGASPEEVSSPTFVILNIYEGIVPVYHFDLYRLKGAEQFFSMGFDEYWDSPGICCMEWSERISDQLPKDPICIRMEAQGEHKRVIEIEGLVGF